MPSTHFWYTVKMQPQTILNFWYKEHGPNDWFSKNDAFDAEIREKFLPIHEAAVRGELRSWREMPQGRLAEILVLDQFSRNIYRNDARSFATDTRALELAEDAIAMGDDLKLSKQERQFLYMPLMHSESKDTHSRALWLFATLLPQFWNAFLYEWKHKRIIDRFGRYPHRNEILGRTSTPEEEEFLKTHPGF